MPRGKRRAATTQMAPAENDRLTTKRQRGNYQR